MKKKGIDNGPSLFDVELLEVPTKPVLDPQEPVAGAEKAEAKANIMEAGSSEPVKDTPEPVAVAVPAETNKNEKTYTYYKKGEKKMKQTEKKQAQTTVTLNKSTANKAKRLALLDGVSLKTYFEKLVDERFARERAKLIQEINNL